MVVDLIALAVIVMGWAIARRTVRTPWHRALPRADWPPPAARAPLPKRRHLRRYARRGVDEIEEFLARRGTAVD